MGRFEYKVRGIGRRETIIARNIQDAVNKVARKYPKTKTLGVERVGNREYETTWIRR